MNSFSLGAQIGGPDVRADASAQEQWLRDAFNRWKGEYSSDVREFAFLLRIDGQIHAYTKMWNIHGAQRAKCKRDWIEVEIGIPESWWRDAHGDAYKKHLADEIERGVKSMIEPLREIKHDIKAESLLKDWKQIKSDYLSTT